MKPERSFGLQWRLAVIFVTVGAFTALTTIAAYLAGFHLGLTSQLASVIAVAAGFIVGLAGAVIGSIITRSVKLRLWEAGRMAVRIAGGDYSARLEIGPDDEVGWLEEQLNRMASQLQGAVDALKDLAEQNRLLGEEAGRGAALEERMRLARDLHDTVNQQLFVLSMRSAALRKQLEELGGDAAFLAKEAKGLEEIAGHAHKQIRDLILQIRPIALQKEGLGAALKDYLQNLAEKEGWEADDQIDPSLCAGGTLGESLFRVAQEGLNNISKHASAKVVTVVLHRKRNIIQLSIIDDGIGFNLKSTPKPTAVGLVGMRERVKALDGKLMLESSPGRGTELTVIVPFNHNGSDGG